MSRMSSEKRVQFDFEIDFSNGGGLSGHAFRLDIGSDDIADSALADAVVRDLRLLMVGAVRIRNKTIIAEPHKRSASDTARFTARRLVDLSHTIEDGMITYKGLPAPLICNHMSREQSRAHYAPGTEFQIGRITMVANTGTYIDSPFHRFADGADVADFELARIAMLDAIVVRATGLSARALSRNVFSAFDVRGKAVLVHTGWDANWRTDRYFEGHPFLSADAAMFLRDAGARLVGIDSLNIDDIADTTRPVHTTLLGAGIPIVEHLCNLGELPSSFLFSAVPPKVRGMGTFPVRAFALCE
ncbi:MAG TPA: cyclase family protein [Rhodanobacteraceae bacterium]|jgi:kynurenine formamidase|nr:cyclase family protein [Rhodanobacteraceae bacterium]